MKRILKTLGIVLLVVMVWWFLIHQITEAGAVARVLPFGWFQFLERQISQVTLNWSVIGMGILCSVGLIAIGNQLLRGMQSQIRQARGLGPAVPPWKWKWTLGLYAVIWILFAIAFGAAGIYRHTSWLMNAPRPWYPSSNSGWNDFMQFKQAHLELSMVLSDNLDLNEARAAAYSIQTASPKKNPIWEEYTIILFGDAARKAKGCIIIPRKGDARNPLQFGFTRDSIADTRPISELSRVMAEFEALFPTRSQ